MMAAAAARVAHGSSRALLVREGEKAKRARGRRETQEEYYAF